MKKMKETLADEFVKDLGSLRYFLGMEIARSKLGISICQHKYTLDLLKEIGMLGCKLSETLVDQNERLLWMTKHWQKWGGFED